MACSQHWTTHFSCTDCNPKALTQQAERHHRQRMAQAERHHADMLKAQRGSTTPQPSKGRAGKGSGSSRKKGSLWVPPITLADAKARQRGLPVPSEQPTQQSTPETAQQPTSQAGQQGGGRAVLFVAAIVAMIVIAGVIF